MTDIIRKDASNRSCDGLKKAILTAESGDFSQLADELKYSYYTRFDLKE
ncbi:MAG: hypothetical protein IKP20_08070 [Candidatus Methanomethylophilaceae archaeon]|nr:hypothetical protein [Candidatus Methanomethylophilaceae archaeon]